MENNRIFSLLFDKILDEPGTNPRVNGFEKVRNLGSREFNILRLKDLQGKGEAWCYLQDRLTRRAHLKSDVLVLLENPSGVFEDLVHIFLSQLLEIRHSWLEFFAHVGFVLAETERRSKEHAGLVSPTGW
jgi:hypothetical protein